MARRNPDALAKQKEARQKKLLFALLPVLLLLLAWQGPGMLKAFSGGDAPAETAPAPAPSSATEPVPTPAPSDPAAVVPPATPAAATPADPPVPAAELPETDVPVAAGAGQLVALDRFVGKDPFKQQVVEKEGGGSGDAGSSGSTSAGGRNGSGSGESGTGESAAGSGAVPTANAPSGGGGEFAPDDGKRTSATVDVNGTREELFVASTFPNVDPIFRIVSIAPKSAKIELVTGQFSNGRTTLTLRLGKRLTLVSQPDGLRYVVTLLATGTKSA
jgi:hypothetical protein